MFTITLTVPFPSVQLAEMAAHSLSVDSVHSQRVNFKRTFSTLPDNPSILEIKIEAEELRVLRIMTSATMDYVELVARTAIELAMPAA